MDQEVEAAPALLENLEGSVDGAVIADVAGYDDIRASFGGQWLDPLAQCIALISKGKLGAVLAARLGDAPGDGPRIGHPHDEPPLARHNWTAFDHDRAKPCHTRGRQFTQMPPVVQPQTVGP